MHMDQCFHQDSELVLDDFLVVDHQRLLQVGI